MEIIPSINVVNEDEEGNLGPSDFGTDKVEEDTQRQANNEEVSASQEQLTKKEVNPNKDKGDDKSDSDGSANDEELEL